MSTHPTAVSRPQPTVSRVFDDRTLVELLYNGTEGTTALAVARSDGSTSVHPYVEVAGERLVPYAATNNLLANGCVLLPGGIGQVSTTEELAADLRAFISRYVDLSPFFAEVAPWYVLLSWVYDAFRDLPYLRFRGDYGTGKTRALLTLGSVSYKPFFASGASTVSPIFHVLDVFRGTLVLDEADLRFSDATAQLTKILNNGTTDGVPILRTMANKHGELNPRAFRVYGPKLVGMRESFTDRALESRFLTEETGGRPLRADIPVHLSPSFDREAAELRDRLLAWRFAHRWNIVLESVDRLEGLEPRFDQGSRALLSLIDDPAMRGRIVQHLMTVQGAVRAERAATPEAQVLSALITAADAGRRDVAIGTLTATLNAAGGGEQGHWTAKRLGAVLRTRFQLSTSKSRGVYVVPAVEWPRLAALAERYGLTDPGISAPQRHVRPPSPETPVA